MEQFIYTLTDPEDGDIKYIGKTNNIEKRVKRHYSDYYIQLEPWTKKNKWLKYLKNKKLVPIIEILDIGDDNNINSLEKYWICQFKVWGFKLKNQTDGGDGVSWLGKKHSEESKKLMKISNTRKRSIIMYDLNLNPIKKFISIRGAERETGIFRQQIKFSCDLKGSAGSCYFRYDEDKLDILENENWKDYVNKRNYGNFDKSLDKEFLETVVKKSKSYRDIADNLNVNYNSKVKHYVYYSIKKYNINIDHFTRKEKK